MAEIKMDISEYEIMKENKKLLENSLNKERELQEQIKRLTDERTEALENSRMKVIKISKSEVTEHLIRKREDSHIFYHLNNLFSSSYNRVFDFGSISTNTLVDALFEKLTTRSLPREEITVHGLDEIKVEIRTQLEKEIDDETKKELNDAAIAVAKNKELVEKNIELQEKNDFLTSTNAMLLNDCKRSSNELKDLNNNYNKLKLGINNALTSSEKYNTIKKIMKNGYGLFNKSELLNKIILTIEENDSRN